MKNNESFGMSIEYLLCIKSDLNGEKIVNIKKRTEIQFIENIKLLKCIDEVINQLPKIIDYVGLDKKSSDFILDKNKTLSVKSNTHKNGKVCPQLIGQPTKNKFCEYFGLNINITNEQIKKYIIENVHIMLKQYYEHLFDSDYLLWIYNNKNKNGNNYEFKIINKHNTPNFDKSKITFTRFLDKWDEGTTIKYNSISIGEFQIHKNRNCIKFRFMINNLLNIIYEMENILALNYIGSKKTLINTLDRVLSKYITKDSIFGDLCSGTGIVSQFVKYKYGCSIISNDLQEYSKIITEAKMNSYDEKEIKIISECFEMLNNEKLIKGFFYENYKNKYFTSNNCKKIDTIRQCIDKLKISNKIKIYLLASLISTADKKSNCAGVYGSYLKKIKKSAQGDIILTELPIVKESKENKYISYTGDLFEKQITDIKYTVIYIDPPYNNRQYGSNYHILETMAKYDNPEIKGKTGLRLYDKSDFCYKSKIKKMFESLKNKLTFETLIISYSSEGLMNIFDIIEIFIKTYKVVIYEKEYKKFKSQKTQKNDKITEYIIVIENKENKGEIVEFINL